MGIEQMRAAIAAVYKTSTWRKRVSEMNEGQIIAIYKKFRSCGKIK